MRLQRGSPTKTRLLVRQTICITAFFTETFVQSYCKVLARVWISAVAPYPTSCWVNFVVKRLHNFIEDIWNEDIEIFCELVPNDGNMIRIYGRCGLAATHINMQYIRLVYQIEYSTPMYNRQRESVILLVGCFCAIIIPQTSLVAAANDSSPSGAWRSSSTACGPLTITCHRLRLATLKGVPLYCSIRFQSSCRTLDLKLSHLVITFSYHVIGIREIPKCSNVGGQYSCGTDGWYVGKLRFLSTCA